MSPRSFDPLQQRVLDHARGPLLVLGGPGTGKTEVLAERFARLVEADADPERIVLLSLTRRGAHSARGRILDRLGRSLPEINAMTWHGLALRTLATHWQSLDYTQPPRLLTAPEQYARVGDLLENDGPERWPTLDAYRPLRRFGREVADFVLRAQERLLPPEQLLDLAEARARPDLAEVSGFYGRYLDALNSNDEVDFAGLLNQAVAAIESVGAPDVDHVLVDDLQDVTAAGERILSSLERTATSVVVTADPGGHVFSFRGASLEPLNRLSARSDVEQVELTLCWRLTDGARSLCDALQAGEKPGPGDLEAWRFAQPAAEADAVAREILRLHLEEALPWSSVAVILRRRGEYASVLRRAFTHHGVPHVVSGEASAIVSEPAVRPIVQLLRFALREDRREELLEGLLVTPVGGLHPHDVRALRRAAKAMGPGVTTLAAAEAPPESLSARARDGLAAFWERVALVRRSVDEGHSPDRVFFALWESLPHLRELVERAETDEAANRDLDALYQFASNLERFRERRPWTHLQEYLDVLDVDFAADPFAQPEDRMPDSVRVLTAHRAHGEEFAVAFVVGALEGEFPRMVSARPMVDLDDLDRPRSARERFEARFAEERALFRLAVSRGRRLVLTASESRDSRKPRSPSRFAPAEAWGAPGPSLPPSLAQAEAEHRRALADQDRPAPERLAALAALAAVPARPATWWGARSWTEGPPLHEGEMKTSYSRLSTFENCPLQYLFDVELGLDFVGSHHMWLGSRVHQIIEEYWTKAIERTPEAMEKRLDELWRPEVFPSRAVEHRRRLDASEMIRKFLATEADTEPVLVEHAFKFPLDGALLRGRIDAIMPVGEDGLRVIDYKTGRSTITQKETPDNLQLGAYLLALRKDPELAKLGIPSVLELSYIGTAKDEAEHRSTKPKPEDIPRFEQRITEYLQLIRDEAFAPSPEAACRNCAYKTLCPIWREGAEVRT